MEQLYFRRGVNCDGFKTIQEWKLICKKLQKSIIIFKCIYIENKPYPFVINNPVKIIYENN